MSADLESLFIQASEDVTKLSEAPDNLTKLKLYALYKQGSKGACTGDRPGMMDFVARAKYDAWKELGDISQDEGKQHYIDLVESLKAADA